MLGKLMKYEWKATWKLLLSANLLTVAMTGLARWMVYLMRHAEYSSNFRMVDFVAVMVLFSYVASMFAVYVGTGIYLIHRFYTSTYGDQGYLLHTLPVDTHHIIIAKVLVSVMWVLMNSLIIYFSVIVLIASSTEMVRSMMEGLVNTIEYLGAEKISAFTVTMTIVAYIFSLLAKVLKVGACISLGQLSPNHKLMLSFAWYVGIYIVQGMLQGVYFAIRTAIHIQAARTDYFSYFGSDWETTLLGGIVSCVIFYILIWYVMERKLNLD
ncbi:MAG: hypothetical protein K2M20_04505 [Lachnospiraceae bacterium]|nr:hypothetical protein [Lachnospiraceae bacterium]MDE6602993.1 hypothetical protein [Lachnospiraceae bacterium]